MPEDDLTQFTIAGNKWTGQKRYADFITMFAADPELIFRKDTCLVSDRKMRAVAVIPIEGETGAHVKKYKAAGLIPRLRHVLRISQADYEFANLLSARDAALPVPEIICFGRRGGCAYLATVLVPSATPLVKILRQNPGAFDDSLTNNIADLIARTHEAGLLHRDLHLGNILRDASGGLHLVDWHRALAGTSISDEEAAENLGQLDFSVSRVTDRERRKALIEAYLRMRAIDMNPASFADAVFAASRAWGRRHFMSRTRRCTRDSGEFAVEKIGGMTIYRRREFTDDIPAIIRKHRQILDEGGDGILKVGRKTRLTALPDTGGERRICVKEFRGRGPGNVIEMIARGARGMRAWINANGLLARGISTPRPLALARTRGREYLLTRFEEDTQPLDQWLRERFEQVGDKDTLHRKWTFMRAIGRMLAALHGSEVFHKDFKANNILVTAGESGPRFFLLDLDRMRFDEPLSRDDIEFNIACLNAAVGNFITMTDRLRAFREYLGRGNIGVEDKEMIRRIVKISIARDHFWRPRVRGRRRRGEV
ncbi:MAG: hypothetical protein DRP79_08490 [Planctomycetota bacterium]|nr:MAG: hypothetical protein DRP79_08490 [Planctomycetota bacterium]